MTPLTMTCTMQGLDSGGSAGAVLACKPVGPIRRSIGLFGDDLVVQAPKADVEALDWDWSKPVAITFGDAAAPITLGGYYLNRISVASVGVAIGDTDPTLQEVLIFFETQPRKLREARGGLLTIGTVNKLGTDGLVDDGDADYMDYQELVDACLDAIGLTHDACPSSINTAVDGTTAITAPGPLDWGNANAIAELEALLSQVGYTAVFANDGSKIAVVRLLRAGENISLPTAITDYADAPFIEFAGSVRSRKIVVTSGRTRATIITSRSFDDTDEAALEWVAFDPLTGDWLNDTQWNALYATNLPGDLATFQAGPDAGAGPANLRNFARVFTAVRLTGDDLTKCSRFVTPADLVTAAQGPNLGRVAAMCSGRFCRDEGAGMYRNWPASDVGTPIVLDGVQPVPGEGVFILPTDVTWTRMNPGPLGTCSEARLLADDDLTITFAHEANTGVFKQDYFVVGYTVSVTSGVVSVTEMDDTALDAAIADPMSLKLEAPFLRLISYQDMGDATPTPINDTVLKAVAEQLALFRAGDEQAQTAVIRMRGWHNIAPGDASGAVSSVEWRLESASTIVTCGAHEVPRAGYDREESRARRSVAAGLRRFSNAGTSAGMAATRAGSTPGELAGLGGLGGGGGAGAPESMSGTRGREQALRGGEATKSPGVRPGEMKPPKSGLSFIWAKITGATAFDGGINRWEYDWTEVYVDDDLDFVEGVRDSDTYGIAIAAIEAFNTGGGVEGNGVNVTNLTGTFALQPIQGNAVALLVGPYTKTDGTPFWIIAGVTNAIDGSCPVLS